MADASESMPTTESGTREERPRWQDQPRPWKESTSTLGLLVKVAVFVLPPALYIAGFVLTLKTIESPNFVRADQLTSPPPGSPVQFTNHTLHSSLAHLHLQDQQWSLYRDVRAPSGLWCGGIGCL